MSINLSKQTDRDKVSAYIRDLRIQGMTENEEKLADILIVALAVIDSDDFLLAAYARAEAERLREPREYVHNS